MTKEERWRMEGMTFCLRYLEQNNNDVEGMKKEIRRREAGRKGGEAKKSTSEGVQVKQSLANQAVTVNGTVTDTVNVNGTVTCNEGEAPAGSARIAARI